MDGETARALVLEIVRGDTTSAEAARKHGLTVAEIEDWRDRFLSGAGNALKSKPLDDEALREAEVKKLKQKIGELVMDIDIIKEAAKPYMPNPSGRQSSVLKQNASETSSRSLFGRLHAPRLPPTVCHTLGHVPADCASRFCRGKRKVFRG